MRPLIVPAPHQTDQQLAQLLLGLAAEQGLPASVVEVDSTGPRNAYRVTEPLYDAWLAEIAGDGPQTGEPVTDEDQAGAGVEGSAAPADEPPPAAPSTDSRKVTKGKRA